MVSWDVLNFVLVNYTNASQLTFLSFDPWMWPDGSYELRLSVLASGNCLGIGSLVFSGTQHGVRGPCGVVYDSYIFGMHQK